MTERLLATRKRVESLDQLETMVVAIRGISASRAQQARAMLDGVNAFAAVIGNAIGQALALTDDALAAAASRRRDSALVLFCAEQGFAGAFSERMIESLARPFDEDVFLIGSRGLALAREQGVRIVWHSPMVPHAQLVSELAIRIAEAIYGWVADKADPHLDVAVPVWSPGSGLLPARSTLLPFDFRRFAPVRSNISPLTTLPTGSLLGRLAEEYIFAELCEAGLIAFTSENEARVASMLAAKTNLERMSNGLRLLGHRLRQEEITAEVIELASGAKFRT